MPCRCRYKQQYPEESKGWCELVGDLRARGKEKTRRPGPSTVAGGQLIRRSGADDFMLASTSILDFAATKDKDPTDSA
jgi:hypothetical protein